MLRHVANTTSILIALAFSAAILSGCSGEKESGAKSSGNRATTSHDQPSQQAKATKSEQPSKAPEAGHAHTEGEAPHGHEESSAPLVPLTQTERENIGLKTVVVTLRPLEDVRRFPGVIKPHPDRVAVVTSRTPGKIVDTHAKVGERVIKGQDLIEVQSIEVEKLEIDLIQAENKTRAERSKLELELAQAENKTRAERSKLELELAQAENKLRLAQAETERNRALVEKGIGARKDLIAAENQLQAVQNELAGLKRQMELQVQAAQNEIAGVKRQVELLAQTSQVQIAGLTRQLGILGLRAEEIERIRREQRMILPHFPAPISGVIVDRPVNLGQMVDTTTTLFKIIDDLIVLAEGDVFEDVLPSIRIGQRVRLAMAAYPKRIFEGTITFIQPAIDPDKRTAHIWAQIPNSDRQLKPDMFVQLNVVVGGGTPVLAAPAEAVLAAEGQDFVFVEREGGFARVPIATGVRNDQFVEVKRGLKAGDKIVTDGKRQLYTKLLTMRSGGTALGGHTH